MCANTNISWLGRRDEPHYFFLERKIINLVLICRAHRGAKTKPLILKACWSVTIHNRRVHYDTSLFLSQGSICIFIFCSLIIFFVLWTLSTANVSAVPIRGVRWCCRRIGGSKLWRRKCIKINDTTFTQDIRCLKGERNQFSKTRRDVLSQAAFMLPPWPCVYVCVNICTYIYIYTGIYVYILYIHVYIYIRVYIFDSRKTFPWRESGSSLRRCCSVYSANCQ